MAFHYRHRYQTLATAFVVSAVAVNVACITLANSDSSAVTVTATNEAGTTIGTWVVPGNNTIVIPMSDGQDGACKFFNGLTFLIGAATTRVFVVASR